MAGGWLGHCGWWLCWSLSLVVGGHCCGWLLVVVVDGGCWSLFVVVVGRCCCWLLVIVVGACIGRC